MKVQLVACSLLVVFAWAVVESGQVGNRPTVFSSCRSAPAVRQIELLEETPTIG